MLPISPTQRRDELVSAVRRGAVTTDEIWQATGDNYQGDKPSEDHTFYNDLKTLLMERQIHRLGRARYGLGELAPREAVAETVAEGDATAAPTTAPPVIELPPWRLVDVLYWLGAMQNVEPAELAKRLTPDAIEKAAAAVKLACAGGV